MIQISLSVQLHGDPPHYPLDKGKILAAILATFFDRESHELAALVSFHFCTKNGEIMGKRHKID